jgi:hypothetical protein
MVQLFLIGLGAGAAAALLFASVASGSPLAILLFYLAPLPILIASMGWSHWAALIASIVASASVGALFGVYFFAAFLIGVGLPAWWLGYLALLARPTADGGLEWYPVGHLVFWAAIISAVIVILGILSMGPDEESFRASLRSGVERALDAEGLSASRAGGRLDWLVDTMVTAMPMAAAVLATVTVVVNLGLAARIVNMSGRLRRPWPELSAMRFPAYGPAVMATTVAGSFVTGMTGLASGALMASMLVAYAMLGFAVLHSITRGTSSRPFVLGGAYAAVVVLFWPAIVLTLLGLADTALDLRGRARARGGPPHPRT